MESTNPAVWPYLLSSSFFLYWKAHLEFLTKSFKWYHVVESAKLSDHSSCDSPSAPTYCHNVGHL